MLHNNKKGISVEFLAATIIVLIGFFAVSGGIMVFKDKLPSAEADIICKTSVASAAKYKKSAVGFGVTPSPKYCKTQEFTINAKGKTNNQVLTELMNHAARAWNVWGEGHYAEGVFDEGYSFFSKDTCFRYYNVKIKNLQGTIKQKDVKFFMETTDYKKTNNTYWSYIAQNTEHSGFMILDDIETQHIYSIHFADVRMGVSKSIHYNMIIIADINRKEIPLPAIEYDATTMALGFLLGGPTGVALSSLFGGVDVSTCNIVSSTGNN